MTDIVERLEDMAATGIYPKEVSEAAHEIERLTAALQSMLTDPPATLDEPDTDAEVIIKMRAIARRALEPKP